MTGVSSFFCQRPLMTHELRGGPFDGALYLSPAPTHHFLYCPDSKRTAVYIYGLFFIYVLDGEGFAKGGLIYG